MPEVSTIHNPRWTLVVGLESDRLDLCRIVKDLTALAPDSNFETGNDVNHNLHLKTPYYTATLPMRLSLISKESGPEEWATVYLSPEAKEVYDALGGFVVVFSLPQTTNGHSKTAELIKQAGRVLQDGLGGGFGGSGDWDGVSLAIGVGNGDVGVWEDLCFDAGFEFVQVTGNDEGRDEHGGKKGIARVKETLEANDWAQEVDDDSLSDFGEFAEGKLGGKEDDEVDFDPEDLSFGFDRADFEGLRAAIWKMDDDNVNDESKDDEKKTVLVGGEPTSKGESRSDENQGISGGSNDIGEEDVQQVEAMFRKLQTARERGADMGEMVRKRMASRVAHQVAKELFPDE